MVPQPHDWPPSQDACQLNLAKSQEKGLLHPLALHTSWHAMSSRIAASA